MTTEHEEGPPIPLQGPTKIDNVFLVLFLFCAFLGPLVLILNWADNSEDRAERRDRTDFQLGKDCQYEQDHYEEILPDFVRTWTDKQLVLLERCTQRLLVENQ